MILLSLWQWTYMRGEDHWLGEDWWQADVKGHIVLVHELASLTGYLVHHPCTKWAKRSTIVLTDIAGVVANGGKNPVCWVWNEAMRPEVLCPRVEVSGELKNRIAQLPTKKINELPSETTRMHQQNKTDWGFPYSKSFEVENLVLLIELYHDLGKLWNVVPWTRKKDIWRFGGCLEGFFFRNGGIPLEGFISDS
jgi:hypothetical protein